MLGVGFVVSVDDGAEVYQLHASPEQWPKLLQSKSHVEMAVQQAKQQQQQQQTSTSASFGAGPGLGMGVPGGFPGRMPGMAMGNSNLTDPNMHHAVTEMLSNPEALQAALQVRWIEWIGNLSHKIRPTIAHIFHVAYSFYIGRPRSCLRISFSLSLGWIH
jgi:hypothetical protein